MFEKETYLSKSLKEKMERFVKSFGGLDDVLKLVIAKDLLDLINEAYEEGLEDDDSRCDDCDERRGEPIHNEGYD